ncbi:hypothetical protein [Bradyrhizobium sp.]|jgi:hypothetical protein|uniref:hypothetical protein n=1 Tax=Bradyrhizobium sp. TaxID=376 RepID=UPI002DFEFBB4|nr:hypothetical protein [Bradyrhizobium sp.]
MTIAEVSRVTFNAQPTESGADAPAKAASVALVPVVATPRRLTPAAPGLTRPDPSFVVHLIAMAEQSPQTRMLRRAAPADAQAAYRSVANQNQPMLPPGIRMRHSA